MTRWTTSRRNAQPRGRPHRCGSRGVAPGLSLSTLLVAEQGAQGGDILTFTPQNAIAPSAVSLSNVDPAGSLQMNADGVTLEYGAVPIDREAAPAVSFTASFVVNGVTYNFPQVLAVTNINEAPEGDGRDIGFSVPPGAAVSSPGAFDLTMWNLADAGTNGDATVNITNLPSTGGSAFTAFEANVNGSPSWVSLGGTTTGSYNLPGCTDDFDNVILIRAVNAINPGAASDSKTIKTTGVPAAFTSGLWSVAAAGTYRDAVVTVTGVPNDNGRDITALQYKVGAGAWTALGGSGTGTYPINDAFTDGVSNDIMLRAVNSAGNGTDGDVQTVNTYGTGIQLVGFAAATSTAANYTVSLTALTGGSGSAAVDGDFVVVYSGISCGSNVTVGINTGVSTGWSEESEQYANDTRDANGRLAYKRMGVSPDTSVSVLGGNNAGFASLAIVAVLRGVNAATPLDVAVVLASGIDTALINPPSISPGTTGAMVLVGGLNTALDGALTDITAAPSGFTDLFTTKRDTTNMGGNIAMAIQAGWSSGAVDAGVFTGATDSVNESWVGFAMALRPA